MMFMLVAHGIMNLRFDNDSKQVHFHLAKLFYDNSILALQHDQC